MSGSPSSDADPTDDWRPLAAGMALWRETVLAWVGLPLVLAGLNGWLYFLRGEFASFRYGFLDLFRDAGFVLVGLYVLFVAVGSATRRLRSL